MATSKVTPLHIKPEWYFLSSYAILRSIPNKLTGVCIIILSVAFWYLFILIFFKFNKKNIILYYFLVFLFILIYIGINPVTEIFTLFGLIFGFIYFFILINIIIYILYLNKFY